MKHIKVVILSLLISLLSSPGSSDSIDTLSDEKIHKKEVIYRVGINSHQITVKIQKSNKQVFTKVLSFDLKTDNKPEIYTKILTEPEVIYRILIAEGVSTWQLIEALKMADFLTGDVTKMPSEGSLAPTSYKLIFGTDRNILIAQMQRKQNEILADAWENRDPETPLKTSKEALILASMIEKETGIASERDLVASVFINRLAKSMKLGTDPAVIYGLTRGQRFLGRGLTRSELRLDTPFNTYINSGLPPTPISNPGKLAIQSALKPSKTKYLFFISDGSGGHVFMYTQKKNKIDKHKDFCEEIGFTPKTEGFGNCVLKLMDKD